jgi:hypothetical protein
VPTLLWSGVRVILEPAARVPQFPKHRSNEGGGGARLASLERSVPTGNGKEKVAEGMHTVLDQGLWSLDIGPATQSKLALVNIHECDTVGLTV